MSNQDNYVRGQTGPYQYKYRSVKDDDHEWVELSLTLDSGLIRVAARPNEQLTQTIDRAEALAMDGMTREINSWHEQQQEDND